MADVDYGVERETGDRAVVATSNVAHAQVDKAIAGIDDIRRRAKAATFSTASIDARVR